MGKIKNRSKYDHLVAQGRAIASNRADDNERPSPMRFQKYEGLVKSGFTTKITKLKILYILMSLRDLRALRGFNNLFVFETFCEFVKYRAQSLIFNLTFSVVIALLSLQA